MPIANIANKTFPFSTVVGMIVGATSSLKKHVDYSKLQLGNHKVSSFFETKESPIELQVTNAEILFTNFLIVHNVPIAVGDHAGLYLGKCFPIRRLQKSMGVPEPKLQQLLVTC